MGGARRHLALVGLGLVAAARSADASPIEVFGFGSEHAAEAGAGVALADDFAAVYYNPAGLGAGSGKHATIGLLGAVSNLRVEGRRLPLHDGAGLVVGLTAPAPLGGPLENRIRIGIGMYLLPGTIAEIVAHYPSDPFFPWYDNRLQRIVILPGVGVRIADNLWVGGAINFLAGLSGGIVAGEGETRALEARVDEGVPSVARVNAGVLWQPLPCWRVGLTYRERFEVPFATTANTTVAGEPIDLDLRASGQFTPDEVALGGSWRGPQGKLGLDAVWSHWSAYPGPFVVVTSELPLVGPLAGALPTVPYKDTIAVRVGGEVHVNDTVRLRGGYAFETSPIPAEQSGVTNLLDGPKHTIGLGLGIGWRTSSGKHMRLDLHVQAQLVGSRTLHKVIYDPSSGQPYDPFTSLRDEVTDDPQDPSTQGAQISNPGYPTLQSGGQVFSGGLTLEADL